MKCIWLGQAGLLFDFDGIKVMMDPYLSDSVAAVNPLNKRRIAVDESFFDIRPDVLILTHDHLDTFLFKQCFPESSINLLCFVSLNGLYLSKGYNFVKS